MSSEQSHDVPEITPPFPSDHWRDGEIERHLTMLRRIVVKRRVVAYTVLGTWAALLIAVGYCAAHFPASNGWSNCVCALLLGVYPLGFVIVLSNRAQKRVTRDIAEIDDVAALGAMFEARAVTDNNTTARVLREAMTKVLLRIKASDRQQLSDRHYRKVRAAVPERLQNVSNALRPGQTEFVIALLRAIEQIGDATFVERVERLTRDQAKTEAQRRVQSAAEECLVNLRARLDDTGAVLLRVPEVNEAEDNLLRPAQSSATADAVTLLRTPGDQIP